MHDWPNSTVNQTLMNLYLWIQAGGWKEVRRMQHLWHDSTESLSRCRMVTDFAFGRLKSRCLHSHLDSSGINAVCIIVTCRALHNLCEVKGESFPPDWTYDRNGWLTRYTQPESAGCTQATETRDALCSPIMDLHSPMEEGDQRVYNCVCMAILTGNEVDTARHEWGD